MKRGILKHIVALGLGGMLLLGSGTGARADEVSASAAQTAVEAAQPETGTVEAVPEVQPNYVIYVNRAANCVTVMAEDAQKNLVPVRAMVCSCGRNGHETPAGTFYTSDYYDWRLMVDGTYGRYAVRFNKKILFHSVPYIKASPDTLEWDQYNLLGQGASLGCVRLSVNDVKWIYDNCRRGTKVIVYDDAENPGPLGKPGSIAIDASNPNRNWDPTDTDVNSPWNAGLPAGASYETFDAVGYAERYPDVKEAYGTDKGALWLHYLVYGKAEGRIAFPENA